MSTSPFRGAARIVSRRPVHAPSAAEHQPRHLRAASGVTWWRGRLAIVQDDASFVALIDPSDPHPTAEWIDLPHTPGGARVFEKALGNKHDKLDLEACFVLDGTLVGVGSGSLPIREQWVVLDDSGVRQVALPGLYAALRRRRDLAGDELNLEGAFVLGDSLWLVQRGNGAGEAVDAVVRLPLDAVRRALRGEDVPWGESALEVHPHALGTIDGVRLTFTDGTPWGDAALFALAAEASPNAVDDGEVVGAALAWGPPPGPLSIARLVDESGAPSRDKIEGVVAAQGDRHRLWVVVDRDDPSSPAELLEVVLTP